MVATAAIPIVTAVGKFAAPYLIREATKLGIKQFIQTYGSTAFQRVSPLIIGGIIAEKVVDAYPPVDLQKEKLFGTSIGSLPGMPTTYYDDTTEKDKKQEISTQVEDQQPKLPEEPPKGPDIGTELATEAAVQTTKKLLEDKKPDITKQTKELVPDTTADVSKEKVDKYFEGIDELYDNEWYGSAKSIRDFIDNTTIDEGDKVYDKQKSIYTSYGMERPIHEFFEDEYQGGVGNLGNKDAAMVMQMGDLYRLGEFNGPEYYQEYIDKLHEYTLNTLGKEFKVYRLTRKDEMESFLNPDRSDEATDPKSFSLNKNRALAFQGLWHDLFTTKEGKPREDLVLIETVVPYDSLIMRGHSGEHEIVVNGEFLSGNEINFYNLKGDLIQGATKGPLVKSDITKQTRELVPEKPKFGKLTKAEIQSKKLLEDKELDVSQQTKNLTSKIKNKITTWEDHFPTIEEATKAAEDVGGTLREFEEDILHKKITFRKTGIGFDILFDRKVVGELNDITQLKQEDNTQIGNTRSYHISIINEDGTQGEPYDTFDGEKNAKEFAKHDVVKALLEETKDPAYPSLRDIFQNLEYNKKGEPKAIAEELERFRKELAEREKNK